MRQLRFLAFALLAYMVTQSGAVEARRAGDEFLNNSVPRNLPKPIPSTSAPSPKFSQGLFDRLSNQLLQSVKARDTDPSYQNFQYDGAAGGDPTAAKICGSRSRV